MTFLKESKMKKLVCAFMMAGHVVAASPALAEDKNYGSHAGCAFALWSSFDAIRMTEERLREMVQNGDIRASEINDDKESEVREKVVDEICIKKGYTPEP
jgi:uncharacterized protein (DUF302 family)